MYAAVFISQDGKWFSTCVRESIEEVWEAIDETGSQHYFYPIRVVVETGDDKVVTESSMVVDDGMGSDGPYQLSELLTDVCFNDR